jgi:hypothetical protein
MDPSSLDQWKLFFQTVIGFWRARPNLSAAEFPGAPGWALGIPARRDSWLAERTQPGDVAIQTC